MLCCMCTLEFAATGPVEKHFHDALDPIPPRTPEHHIIGRNFMRTYLVLSKSPHTAALTVCIFFTLFLDHPTAYLLLCIPVDHQIFSISRELCRFSHPRVVSVALRSRQVHYAGDGWEGFRACFSSPQLTIVKLCETIM